MTSFNLRFITPFVVAAGLMLGLVACGNKVELPQTEAAAIAYVKSKVLAYYHRHPDRFSREAYTCPDFLNLADWSARETSSGRWSVHAMGGILPEPPGAFDSATWKRFQESQTGGGGDATYSILDDGRVISPFMLSGNSTCGGYWGRDPNP